MGHCSCPRAVPCSVLCWPVLRHADAVPVLRFQSPEPRSLSQRGGCLASRCHARRESPRRPCWGLCSCGPVATPATRVDPPRAAPGGRRIAHAMPARRSARVKRGPPVTRGGWPVDHLGSTLPPPHPLRKPWPTGSGVTNFACLQCQRVSGNKQSYCITICGRLGVRIYVGGTPMKWLCEAGFCRWTRGAKDRPCTECCGFRS